MNKQNKRVIVCGAGIGGMTTAHELAKRGIDVTVYERHDILGGLARSKYHKENDHTYPVEYSWRVYGTEYFNLLRVLSEIPAEQQKTAKDHLILITKYLFPRMGKSTLVLPQEKGGESMLESFSKKDKLDILNKVLFCMTLSRSRMDSMDPLMWKTYCEDLSDEAKKYAVRIWGPALGMDPSLMSFPVVARMMKSLLDGYFNSTSNFYVMDEPTNDAWFDHWQKYLESTGHVTFKTGHEVQNLVTEDHNVTGVELKNLETNETFIDSADDIVCSLSVESIAKIVEKNPALSARGDLEAMTPLAKTCRQVQLSVQMFLDSELTYPTKQKSIEYLPDTPWALIIEPQGWIWDDTHSSDPRVKSVLSIGICQTDVPGTVHGKAFTDCTQEEILDEVMDQMVRSYHEDIVTEDGSPIDRENIVLFYIWDTFSYDQETKRFDSWEPKYSNNADSLRYQPETTTSLEGLYFATAYTKTERFIYSMEAAAEAGTRAANAILQRRGVGQQENVFGFSSTWKFFKPLTWLDAMLFKAGLPHPSKLFLGSSGIYVLTYIGLMFMIAITIIRAIV